jgi:hypothetical protein
LVAGEQQASNVDALTTMTPNDRDWRWLAAFTGMTVGHSHAAPIEGEVASNAAALLVILGVWAVAMGLRKLRELRYKPLLPRRHAREAPLSETDAGDPRQTD